MRVAATFLAAAAVLAAAAPSAGAAPRTGFWESVKETRLVGQPPAASFRVIRSRGRTYVRDLLKAEADDDTTRRMRVRKGGRFAWSCRCQSSGIEAVRGRFRGRRAVLYVTVDGVRDRHVLYRTGRKPLREGRWRGTASTGSPIEFYVRFSGALIEGPTFGGSQPMRCSDGQTRHVETDFIMEVPTFFPNGDGSFEITDAAPGQSTTRVGRGTFSAAGASGVYRAYGIPPNGDTVRNPLCDTGVVSFTVRPPG